MTALTAPTIVFEPDTHVYRVDGVVWPSVTSILRAAGLSTNWAMLPGSVQEAAEAKRDLGIAVHAICQALDRDGATGELLGADMDVYVFAWSNYVRDRGIQRWLAVEAPVAHPAYRYAGTLDRIGILADGSFVLCDIKLGNPDDAAGQYQTAAYLEAAKCAHPELLTRPCVRECVQLTDSGTYRLSTYTSRDDWKVFQAALTVFRAQPRSHR